MKEEKKEFLNKLIAIKGVARRYRYGYYVISLVTTSIGTLFAFFLPFAIQSFKDGYTILAIAFLCLSMLTRFFNSIIDILTAILRYGYQKYGEIEAVNSTFKVFNVVRNRVYVLEGNEKISLEPVKIFENIDRYIYNSVSFRDAVVLESFGVASFISMFVGTIVMIKQSTTIKLYLLVIIMIVCMTVIIFVTKHQINIREKYYNLRRKLKDSLNSSKQDLYNVNPINKQHEEFLNENYIKYDREMLEGQKNIYFKESIGDCFKNASIALTVIVLILMSVFFSGKLNMDSFATIIALANLYGRLIDTLSYEIRSIQRLVNAYTEKKSYDSMMEVICEKYLEIVKSSEDRQDSIEKIELKNFTFTHKNSNQSSEHKIHAKEIKFESGETTLIAGESGSGKSTLFKYLTGFYGYDEREISINGKSKVGFLKNTLMYDPDSSLGRRNILEEITLSDKEFVDEEKLLEILNGLDLLEKIDAKSKDDTLIEYLSHSFKDVFSAGQLQRLIISRILYNIDKNTDVLIFDEPVANLDNKTAKDVVEFILKFSNSDRERIVIISSHQVDILAILCDKRYEFNQVTQDYFEIRKFL